MSAVPDSLPIPVVAACVIAAAPVDKPDLARVETCAEDAIRAGDFATALLLTNRILAFPSAPQAARALELRGLVEARMGQTSAARITFDVYLKQFAGSEGAARVLQRRDALGIIGEHFMSADRLGAARNHWRIDMRGEASQFYYRETSSSEVTATNRPDLGIGIDRRDNVDQVLSAIDGSVSASNGDTRVLVRTASYLTQDFRPVSLVAGVRGGGDTERIKALYVDVFSRSLGASVRVGRQQTLGSGIFGIFDGFQAGINLGRSLHADIRVGHPVETIRNTSIDGTRTFWQANIDYQWPGLPLWTSVYAISQESISLIDRQAIGIEARWKDRGITIAAIADYDVHFKRLSMARVSGAWQINERSVLTLTADDVGYPLLTTTNAIIDQPRPDLAAVKAIYDTTTIRQLAVDRTLRVRSLTTSFSRRLDTRWRATLDATLTRARGTVASGGVAAVPGSGTEMFWSLQFNGNGIFAAGDSVVLAARYSDVARFHLVATDLLYRFRVTPRLHAAPRLNISYRTDNAGTGHRLKTMPTVRIEYRAASWLEFDAEMGQSSLHQSWADQVLRGSRFESAWFINAGYRLRF